MKTIVLLVCLLVHLTKVNPPPLSNSNTPTPTADSVDQTSPTQSASTSNTAPTNSPTINIPTNNVPVVNNNNEGTSTDSPSNQQVPTSTSTSSSDTSSSSSSSNNDQSNNQQSSSSNTQQGNHNQSVNPNEQDRGSNTAQEPVTCIPPKVLRNNQCQDPSSTSQTSTMPRITGIKLTHAYPDPGEITATIEPIFSPANFVDHYFYTTDMATLPNIKDCGGSQDDNGQFYNYWDDRQDRVTAPFYWSTSNTRLTHTFSSAYNVSSRTVFDDFFSPQTAQERYWVPTARGGYFNGRHLDALTTQSLEDVYFCYSVSIHEGDSAKTKVVKVLYKAYKLEADKIFPPKMIIDRTEVTNDKSAHEFYLADVRRRETLTVGPYIEALPVDSELVIVRASHNGVRAKTKTPINYPAADGKTETIQPISYPYADGRELDDITKVLSSGCPTDYSGEFYQFEAIFLKSALPTDGSCRVTFTFDKEDFTEDYSETGINYITLASIETVTFEYPTLRERITVRR